MKKVAFVTVDPDSGHAIRGIGFYAKNLLPQLQKQSAKHNIQIDEITNKDTISNQHYDLIHYPYFDLFKHSLPIHKPVKAIVTIHDVIPLQYPNVYKSGLKGKINLELQKLSLKNTSHIITDSNTSAIQIHKLLQVNDEKISPIYLAAHSRFKQILDKSVLLQIKKKYKLPQKFVMYVGDINYSKNINTLIMSCVKLNIPLVLVGKNIAQINELDMTHPELIHLESTKKYLKNPLIHILGFVPDQDMPLLYNSATIYCQPSYSEGFGLPLLEAMSCATPVVASTAGSLTEIIGPKLASYQFDAQNIDQLSAILRKIWENTKFRSANAQTCLDQSKLFSWTKTAKETLDVYNSIL